MDNKISKATKNSVKKRKDPEKRFVLPKDLTPQELERISLFIKSLFVDLKH